MFGKNEIVGKSYFKEAPDKSLFVTSIFFTLQGEGPFAGMPAVFIRLAKCNLACSFCFVGNTKITMAGGQQKRISDVVVGDEVVTWDNGVWKTGKVTNTFVNETDELLRLDFNGNKVFCTKEHPFYVRDRGWIAAEDMEEGDVVLHFSTSDRMQMFNPMKNPETAKKVSESQKGREGYLNRAWDDPEFRRRHIERMTTNNPNHDPAVAIKGFLNRTDHKKTSIETLFEGYVSDLPISFVGHGDLVVNNLCPDFVVDGQQKVIEVWDESMSERWGRDETYMNDRRARLKEGGYDVLFMPLTNKTNKTEVIRKCSEFISNGYTLQRKTRYVNDDDGSGPNGKAWVRLAGGKGKSAKVYNIEVEGTHNYLANNMLVHNCDTFFDDGDWMTYDQIDARVDKVVDEFFYSRQQDVPQWAAERRMVLVVTGGEPTLQQNLGGLITHLRFEASQIESNGILYPEWLPHTTVFVCSPKCIEKDGIAIKYLKPNQKVLERADAFKFVVSADPNSPYHSVPDWVPDYKDVYISPMNIYNDVPKKSKELRNSGANRVEMTERSNVDEVISFWEPGLLNMAENQKNHEYAARLCMERGFRLNLQTHLYASLA